MEYLFTHPIYALAFSNVQSGSSQSRLKLAVGSYSERNDNSVSILGVDGDALAPLAKVAHPYPCTKIGFMPGAPQGSGKELLATTSDCLKLFDLAEEDSSHTGYQNSQWRITPRASLAHSRTDFSAPLTSFSWSAVERSHILTASTNTTVSLWDIAASTAVTQLIAHDKEVYDVAWQPGPSGRDIFASCGADGSVRMFDIRSLEHSTILYEATPPSPTVSSNGASSAFSSMPLLRLAFDPCQPSALAVIHDNSSSVLLIDVRQPGMPVAEFKAHRSIVNGIAWSNEAADSGGALVTVGDDGLVLVWDGSSAFSTSAPADKASYGSGSGKGNPAPPMKAVRDPMLAHEAGAEVNSVAWGGTSQAEFIAFTCGSRSVRTLRV